MRLRHIPGSEEAIATSPYVVRQPQQYQGKFCELFANSNPIEIEIGMGKGKFIMELAKINPQINYLGIERYPSVLLRAIEKREEMELSNIYFLCMDAKALTEVFVSEEVSRIYLNFSDPWPKDRHAKRRLPSAEFLKRYDRILEKDGVLEFKTDNKGLFDFALEEVPAAGWEALKISFDLHRDEEMGRDNVMTEYEEKFSALGNPIYKYVIKRQQ